MSENWRSTRDYRVWRVSVIRRDKVCVLCGSHQNRQAHHLNSGAYFKDLRFDVNNGICLCKDCHKLFHIHYKQGYRKKCTRKDYEHFKYIIAIVKGELNE